MLAVLAVLARLWPMSRCFYLHSDAVSERQKLVRMCGVFLRRTLQIVLGQKQRDKHEHQHSAA